MRSLFSLARGSFNHLGAKLVADGGSVKLKIGDVTLSGEESRKSSQLLRAQYHQKQLESLKTAVDQGKSFHSVSLRPSSSGWIGNGQYMSFAEYRFVTKARLNLLPVWKNEATEGEYPLSAL